MDFLKKPVFEYRCVECGTSTPYNTPEDRNFIHRAHQRVHETRRRENTAEGKLTMLNLTTPDRMFLIQCGVAWW